MSNFGIFYDAPSPNMALSRDSRSKFRKNLFFLNAFNIGKSCQISREKLSTSEVISQKPHGEVENTPSAFRVKSDNGLNLITSQLGE